MIGCFLFLILQNSWFGNHILDVLSASNIIDFIAYVQIIFSIPYRIPFHFQPFSTASDQFLLILLLSFNIRLADHDNIPSSSAHRFGSDLGYARFRV